MGAARALILAASLAACASRELPPLGEAVVVVDTDLPVPRVASGLRVDTYATDGTWLESRDIARRDPRDWPVSFSVQATDDVRERDLLVRVRVHGEAMRDVVGGPRLVTGDRDVTPATEPEPALTVDRLLLVHLRPGERGRATIVARASCAGIVPRLDPVALASCIEGEGTLEPVGVAPLEPDLSTPSSTLAGSAVGRPCPGPLARGRTCVEGGAFVLGADDVELVPDVSLPAVPQRVARLGTFAVDDDEVTVGRYRDALAHGFVAPEAPGVTEGDLGTTVDTACSFSAAPRGREEHALSCVSWRTARAYCTFLGGDLPTEAQWEYVATTAGRPGKTTYPWGDDAPDCTRAIYGRLRLADIPGRCETVGTGPRPVSVNGILEAPGDVSAALVRGLGGGVAEWTRDTPAPYTAPCWSGVDPTCDDPAAGEHVIRGGSWASTAISLRSTARTATSKATSFIGFRCVYPD